MKKLLIACILLSSAFMANAQLKFGLRLAPSFVFNSVEYTDVNSTIPVDGKGLGLRYSTGVFVDYFFGENYAVNLGLNYLAKRSRLDIDGTSSVVNQGYVQLPVGLKLYTNDIATDMKLYFLVGTALDFLVSEDVKTAGRIANDKLNDNFTTLFDANIAAGAGVEWVLGSHTSLFGGLLYQRGLIDNVHKDAPYDKNVTSSAVNSYFNNIMLDMGIKF